jgi:hypothetical protein
LKITRSDNIKDKVKNITLEFNDEAVKPAKEIVGNVSINYDGRYDSISINSQIEDSSDVFTFTEVEGKKKNHPYARLSIMKKELRDPKNFEFKIVTKHVPETSFTNVKFRVTLIQEHKEIASDVKHIKIKKDI